MTDHTGAISTEPVRVDVKSVDRELSNLWRKAAEGDMPGVSAPLTRTLLSNLVVYAANEADAEAAAQVVVELAADHPSRAVVVDAQPDGAERKLEADVSMFCSIGERGRRLCGELVRLHAHGLGAEALGTIMPMLAPDLPVYLWTPGTLHGDTQVYHDLAQIADHWIIDSRAFADDQAFDVVEQACRRNNPPVIIHDLAWISASRWRELVARLFDPRSAREYLTGVTQVDIIHKLGDVEAIIMAAWLDNPASVERPASPQNFQD
jgi:glucose-6-phosphate dehydrogenase assembly protein OpcA